MVPVTILGMMVGLWQIGTTSSSFLDELFPENSSIASGDWTPPTQPLFWVEEDATEVLLEWQTPPEADLDGFNIYRSTDNITFSLLGSVSALDVAFTDSTVTTDSQYYYKVTSFDTTGNENDDTLFIGKLAHPKQIVIDDDGMSNDFNSNGTITTTGSWTEYGVDSGSAFVQSVLQNAVGGENYSGGGGTNTFNWTGNTELLGRYEVFVTYICDPSRGVAQYDVYSGATDLTPVSIQVDQSVLDGTVGAPKCAGQATTSQAGPQWVSLGIFDFQDLPRVELTDVPAAANILADAVAFTRVGVVAPTLVNPPNGAITSVTGLLLNWTDVDDDFPAITYEYQLDDDNTFASIDESGTGLATSEQDASGFSLTDGVTYYWRVRACNGEAVPVCSAYTTASSFTVDATAPVSSVTVTNSPMRDIEERVNNGGFESDLANWTTIGDISVVTGSENGIDPNPAGVDNTKMIRIGTNDSNPATNGNSVDVNILRQDLSHTVSGNGVRSVGFWYNFATYEDGSGFDEPGFMVFMGGKMVHQVWANDILSDGSSATLDTSGWKFLSINLANVDDPTLTIALYAGNSGDLSNQSFVYIDNITTNVATVNSTATFDVTATDNQTVSKLFYRYYVSGLEYGNASTGEDVSTSPLTFTISGQPDNDTIEYWSTDAAGNEETHNIMKVKYDNDAPSSVSDLVVTDDADGNFTLNWTAVSDINPFGVNQVAEYDVRYSTAPIATSIADNDWDALPTPTVLNKDGLPTGSWRAPLVSGRPETYQVHVNDGAATYYFAVKVKDRAGNVSALAAGSIANAGAPSTTTGLTDGSVVINEIMWMGSSVSSADEWIELRNMTDKEIDIAAWKLVNAGTGSTDITLPVGAKLPANGFYTVARYAASDVNSALKNEPNYVNASLELDDAGEVITLNNATAVMIDQTPAGAWAAGTDGVSKISMERNNNPGLGIPLDGSVAGNWHSCSSDSCDDARIGYWDVAGSNYGTPGGDNLSFSVSQLEPQVEAVYNAADNKVTLKFTDIQAYTKLMYELVYDHVTSEGTVTDALIGEETVAINTREFEKSGLYLGTCSANGEICVPHLGLTELLVKVTLGTEGTDPKILEKVLTIPPVGVEE
jgi:hypothetical protein